MKLAIHIGTHKTGSTAIQRFCSQNRERLAARGVLYPSSYLKSSGHHELAWALGVKHPQRDYQISAEEIARAILDEAEKARTDLIIVSSEDFESLAETPLIAHLKDLFAGIPVEVIAYLRRQDDALLAAYNQRVKYSGSRYHGTLRQFTRKPLMKRFNYWKLMQRWSDVFGEDAMRPRLYDQRLFPDGNIIPDFLSVLGLSPQGLNTEQWSSINKSLHPIAIEVLRQTNSREMSREVHDSLVRRLSEASSKYPKGSARIAVGLRREFMQRFQESNALVARKWLGREDGVLFPDQPDVRDGQAGSGQDADRSKEEMLVEVLIDCLVNSIEQPEPPPAQSPNVAPRVPGRRTELQES